MVISYDGLGINQEMFIQLWNSMFHMEVTPDKLLSLFRFSEPIDLRARMFFREKVITTLIDSGADVWLLGRGWQNHPSFGAPNMHQINERVPFILTRIRMMRFHFPYQNPYITYNSSFIFNTISATISLSVFIAKAISNPDGFLSFTSIRSP